MGKPSVVVSEAKRLNFVFSLLKLRETLSPLNLFCPNLALISTLSSMSCFIVEMLTIPPIASEPWIEENAPEPISILDITSASKL